MTPTEDHSLSVARLDARDAKTQRHAELQALLARVEAATGADREIDADIHWLVVTTPDQHRMKGDERHLQHEYFCGPDGPVFFALDQWFGPGATDYPYTASMDAALGLVWRVLPQTWVDLNGPRKYLHIPTPVPNYWRAECGEISGWGATPPLALLAALLKALASQQPRDQQVAGDRSRETPLLNTSEPDEKR